jgi:hypothetical protein
MFSPFTSNEGYDLAKTSAETYLGDNPKLLIIGHFLGSLNLSYGGVPVEMPSGFDFSTGKANYWVYVFKNETSKVEIGVINSPMLGGFQAMEMDLSPYLDFTTMIDMQSEISPNEIIDSKDIDQYFTQNSEFMAKYSNLESYKEGYMGLYYNGPVPEFEQKLYWGFWFIKENNEAEICALDIESKQMECIAYTSVEDENEVDFSISPNPANDILNISNTEFATNYVISNYVGEIVSEGDLNSGTNTLNISNLPSGIYFIQLSNNSGMIKAEKIIVK